MLVDASSSQFGAKFERATATLLTSIERTVSQNAPCNWAGATVPPSRTVPKQASLSDRSDDVGVLRTIPRPSWLSPRPWMEEVLSLLDEQHRGESRRIGRRDGSHRQEILVHHSGLI